MFENTNIAISPYPLDHVKPQLPENALAKARSSSAKTTSTFNSSGSSPFQTDDVQEAGIFDFCNILEYTPMPDLQQLESIYDKSEVMLKTSKKIQKEKVQKVQKEKVQQNNKENKPSKASQKKQIISAKKDAWRPDEDTQLIELHEKYGQKWAKIASMMENRTGKQVRDRYLNMLRPDINHEDWTPEEEELFTTLIEQYGNKWCKIASHLPGRTENQVKNKFYWERKKKSPTPIKKSKRNVPKQRVQICEDQDIESQESVEAQSIFVDEPEPEYEVSIFIEEPAYEVIPERVEPAELTETNSSAEAVNDFFQFESASLFDYSSDEILEENFREINWIPF